MGRLMKEKGVEELLLSMERLQDDGCGCVLDVLGTYEEKYEPLIKASEEKGWLIFHGYQADVRPFIAGANCFVLPSYHEGMANTNLESAAMGRPVITSDIPGCREAVIDGETGFLCKPRDPDSLYEAMRKMADLDADRRAEMGRKGRIHMEEQFDKVKVVDNTVAKLYGNHI